MEERLIFRSGVWGGGHLWEYAWEGENRWVWLVSLDEQLGVKLGTLVDRLATSQTDYEAFIKICEDLLGNDSSWVVIKAVEGVVWVYSWKLPVWLARKNYVHLLTSHEEAKLSGWWQEGDELIIGEGFEKDFFEYEDWRERLNDEMQTGGAVVMRQGVLETQPEAGLITSSEEYDHNNGNELGEDAGEEVEVKSKWLWMVGDRLVKWLPAEDQVYVVQDEVDRADGTGRRMMLLVAGFLLVVLVGSLLWGLQTREERVVQKRFGLLVTEVEHKLQESMSLANLNQLRSEALLQEVDVLLQDLESKGLPVEQLQRLRIQMTETVAVVKGEHQVAPDTWQRLTLIRDNIEATDGYWGNGKIMVADLLGGRIISLDGETKAPEIVASEDKIGKPFFVARGDQVVYVISDMGLLGIDGEEITDLSPGRAVDRVDDLGVFGTSVYVMDAEGIWKVAMVEGELVWDQWLGENEQKGWGGATGMAIDGFIWVTWNQRIEKYAQGKKDLFEVQGLNNPWGNITDIYTDEGLEKLYILDQGLQRVVVLDKETGTFEKEYLWEGLAGVTNIFVDSEQGIMWWMGKQEIWSVDLDTSES